LQPALQGEDSLSGLKNKTGSTVITRPVPRL